MKFKMLSMLNIALLPCKTTHSYIRLRLFTEMGLTKLDLQALRIGLLEYLFDRTPCQALSLLNSAKYLPNFQLHLTCNEKI